MYYYIFEPSAGAKDYERSTQIKQLLTTLGIAGEMNSPTPGRDVEELVSQAASKRYSTLVAVGGVELVNRTARAMEPHDMVFGIIPTREHPDITQLIGASDWKTAAEQLKRRRFLPVRMASMGGTCFLTPASIALPEETELEIKTQYATLRRYGGSLTVAPYGEDESGGSLHVRLDGPPPKKRGFLAKLLGGGKEPADDHTRLIEPWIEITSPTGEPVMVAGEELARTPLRFTTREKPVKLIVGRGTA